MAGKDEQYSVIVLDPEGKDISNCRPARARILLARGRAEVVSKKPMTIRLKDINHPSVKGKAISSKRKR